MVMIFAAGAVLGVTGTAQGVRLRPLGACCRWLLLRLLAAQAALGAKPSAEAANLRSVIEKHRGLKPLLQRPTAQGQSRARYPGAGVEVASRRGRSASNYRAPAQRLISWGRTADDAPSASMRRIAAPSTASARRKPSRERGELSLGFRARALEHRRYIADSTLPWRKGRTALGARCTARSFGATVSRGLRRLSPHRDRSAAGSVGVDRGVHALAHYTHSRCAAAAGFVARKAALPVIPEAASPAPTAHRDGRAQVERLARHRGGAIEVALRGPPSFLEALDRWYSPVEQPVCGRALRHARRGLQHQR